MANQTYFLYAYGDRAVITNTGRGGGTSLYSLSKAKSWNILRVYQSYSSAANAANKINQRHGFEVRPMLLS
jgi:hypothetical protein